MPTSVDPKVAMANLTRAWNASASSSGPLPKGMGQAIDAVLAAKDVTYKYILVTGYLAKVTNASVHARCLQTSSSLLESYDARSLCHKVVVPFEKSKGNLFGLSNEPFVNKPARHPEHDKDNKQLRNRALAREVHVALEAAQLATPDERFAGLAYIIAVARTRATSEQAPARPSGNVSIDHVAQFCREFLASADGGARLVAIWGAMCALLNEDATVSVQSPNASDQFSGTIGDVEIRHNGVVVAAAECKHRPLTSADVIHGIRKASRSAVSEYVFVIADGIAAGQDDLIEDALEEGKEEMDVVIADIYSALPSLIQMLNPQRRPQFGYKVVDMCKQMRKFESANFAARLWNSITSRVEEE